MNTDVFLSRYKILEKEYPSDNKSKYVGKIYGDLRVNDVVYASSMTNPYSSRAFAKCSCLKCNNEMFTDLYNILSGYSVSCGCQKNIKASLVVLSKSKEKYVGKTYKTNEGYDIIITGLRNTHDVDISFINVDIEYSTVSTMQNIKNGQIKYPYRINEYGGYYGVGKYAARIDGIKTKEYVIWMGMLYRCKTSDTYRNVCVCDEWKNFQNFAEWFNNNIYECILPLEIDKDILSYFDNNEIKYYSPDNCIMIPKPLNRLLTNISDMKIKDILRLICRYKSMIPDNILDRIKEYYKLAK